jgi:hypothetical protein
MEIDLTLNGGPQCKGGFQVFAPSSVKILLPVKFTEEIKDESRLDFTLLLETVSVPRGLKYTKGYLSE